MYGELNSLAIEQTIDIVFSFAPFLRWYLESAGLHGLDAKDAASHFLSRAATEDVSPVPFFDPAWFRANYDVCGVNAFLSYLTDRARRLAWPSPLFAPRWYANQHRLVRTPVHPFIHFLLGGGTASPHPLLDVEFLRKQSSAWRSDAIAVEFLTDRTKYHLRPHPLFVSDWYLTKYPDVAQAQVNPLAHFLYSGQHEGRNPNRFFNCAWYKRKHMPPFRGRWTWRLDPLTHYIRGRVSEWFPSPGLLPLCKSSVEVTRHGPKPLIECLADGRNLYSSLGHPPSLGSGSIAQYKRYPIREYNPLFPELTLLFRKQRVAVMYSAKCASLTIVTWWLEHRGLLETALRFSDWPHDFGELIEGSREYIEDGLGFDPQRYQSYKFVRNPLLRAVSGFSHFLADPGPFGGVPGEGMSFLEFLQHLRRTDYLGRDVHFRPQATPQEEEGLIRPTNLRLEEGLEVHFRAIESRHGLARADYGNKAQIRKMLMTNARQGRSELPAGPETRLRFGAIPNYRALLTADAIAEINSLYRCDFDLYHYRPELDAPPAGRASPRGHSPSS
jgi:hypothetical protein